MPTKIKYVPVGMVSDTGNNHLHEIVETHIFNSWSDADSIPRNTIRFGYKMDQNVSTNARNSLKAFDAGSDLSTDLVNNDSIRQETTNVKIVVESRSIHNLANDVPADIGKIKKQIRDIINGDRTALHSSGIHVMTLLANDTIERDSANNVIYRMNLYVQCKQILEKRVIVT